jgi:hypothetical protein
MRNKFFKIAQVATFGLAITFTLSCSSPIDVGEGGGNEGFTITLGIKDIGKSSFTAIDKWYDCRENGTLEEETDDYPTSYSINGTTLSFGGLEFRGNSASIIGTWYSLSFSRLRFETDNSGYSITPVSKVVFTQNSLVITTCAGKAGEEREIKDNDGVVIGKRKVIDCGTYEEIRGTETVRFEASGTGLYRIATYKGKTCKLTYEYSESECRKACTEAYNKAMAEGYDGSGYELSYYYHKIRQNDIVKCLEDNNFPDWSY